jgi:hypothetical protein
MLSMPRIVRPDLLRTAKQRVGSPAGSITRRSIKRNKELTNISGLFALSSMIGVRSQSGAENRSLSLATGRCVTVAQRCALDFGAPSRRSILPDRTVFDCPTANDRP